jgi:hypothetical protein
MVEQQGTGVQVHWQARVTLHSLEPWSFVHTTQKGLCVPCGVRSTLGFDVAEGDAKKLCKLAHDTLVAFNANVSELPIGFRQLVAKMDLEEDVSVPLLLALSSSAAKEP